VHGSLFAINALLDASRSAPNQRPLGHIVGFSMNRRGCHILYIATVGHPVRYTSTTLLNRIDIYPIISDAYSIIWYCEIDRGQKQTINSSCYFYLVRHIFSDSHKVVYETIKVPYFNDI
jgi:hypothetical protein